MYKERERQRLQALFSDLERLAADPDCRDLSLRRELDDLRTRLNELEKQLKEDEQNTPIPEIEIPSAVSVIEDLPTVPDQNAQEHPVGLMVYEKDQVGYSYSNNKLEQLKPADSLPDSVDLFTSPLTISGQAVGEMQIVPPAEKTLTADELSLANAVAQQASLQIQSLRLLAEAERSRAEAESATRHYIHESWDSYLDAINQKERIGFAYDQASVTPWLDKPNGMEGVQELVSVLDEQVGTIYLKPDPDRPLTNSDRGLIKGVAGQIAQQVENIRLLADAASARAKAEEAIRRLTRESWQSYTDQKDDQSVLSFKYDSIEVSPYSDTSLPQDVMLVQPLTVRGETVGQLAIAGWKNMPPEAASLAASIAAQTSIHLETLRLSEELQKRARELEELDRLKSSFLANMSHELRTPLNSILGFTDVMLEGLDGQLTDYMDNDLRLIQKNGQHLLHLINDVLDMAKIESGRMNLHPEKFKLHDLLDEVVSITSTLASEKNNSLFIDESSDRELEVFADNTRIRQVMINLVNNSIKFTEKGKICIKVSPMDGARALITVKDTGIGIPSDKLEAVFQEFTQVDTSTTRKVGGTGLGLPISRKLVDMHGGRLWAESTGVEGEGSTFYVELPFEARITEVIEKKEK